MCRYCPAGARHSGNAARLGRGKFRAFSALFAELLMGAHLHGPEQRSADPRAVDSGSALAAVCRHVSGKSSQSPG